MRKTLARATTAIITLALAACDATTVTATNSVTGEDVTVRLSEVTITLSDTRRVPCIILDYGSKSQSMSCDWSHVDGSDNLSTPRRRASRLVPAR